MEALPVSAIPERPGKTSGWITFRPARGTQPPLAVKPVPRAGAALSSARAGASSLDPVRAALWQSWRHLFPPHALAHQSGNGNIVISWSVQDDPHACYPYAAPVVLRFDEHLLDALAHSDERQRRRIAEHHEPTLRAGMRGYDPYARFPNARVVVIG